MIPAATRYTRACDLDHALQLLAEPGASVIAGGQSLIPAMKLRVARPSLVVDISNLELSGVEERDGAVHIGALTTWSELLDSNSFDRPSLAAVTECAQGIGDLQVRNLGTIGGSIAHAHPASDMPAVLLVLGATVHLRSPKGERELELGEILVGPFATALGQDELVTEIVVQLPVRGSGSAYVSVEHPASGYALAGAAALVGPQGEIVAVTGVGATPSLLPSGDIHTALAEATIYGDRFAPTDYRRELAEVVAERALVKGRKRATEAHNE